MTGRGAVGALIGQPAEPVKLLVSGGVGTGKTTALTEVRDALRAAGLAVLNRPPRRGDVADGAYVVDDAHLLDDADLRALAGLVDDPQRTVVVGTAPLMHRAALTDLTTALSREAAPVALGPRSGRELLHAAADVLGAVPPADVGRALLAATAGLPFLLYPAIDAVRTADVDAPAAAVHAGRVALIERLAATPKLVLDTLLLCSLSSELGPDDVAAALGTDDADTLVDEARATGLLSPAHNAAFARSLHRSLVKLVGTARHHDVEHALLRSQLANATLTTDLALRLAEHGMRDATLADELAARASREQVIVHGRAARLYRAAAEAGATALVGRLADELAMTGDCATAGRLTDDLLASDDPAERTAAVRIAASIAMHDGSAAQAADLFRWLGPQPAGHTAHVAAAAVVVSVATGDPMSARAALDRDAAGPPTSTARAARSLAEGLLRTLDAPYSSAMARMSQALIDQRPPGVAPDSAAALVTLVALHGGDPVRARSVIGRAVRSASTRGTSSELDGGDDGFTVHRHRLLLGWVRMLDGQLGAATANVDATSEAALHRRDALWANALRAAIARRSGDGGAVQKHWYDAVEVLSTQSVDLFSLLPLGELWVAAARLGRSDRLRPTIDDAFALLESLGNPVLWSLPLHWAGVHAGILANDPGAVAPHGQALTAAAAVSPFAKALAAAGRTWLRVLANHVDVDDVGAAARGLAQCGLTWDATRLASQAALQTPDGRVSSTMLQIARDLKLDGPDDDVVATAPVTSSSLRSEGLPTPFARLSDREREVGELLLQGLQYRDIGSQLLISAKTVEHHVARIRRRLGAESRSEMLSMLRAVLS